jgi:hypothetical protein
MARDRVAHPAKSSKGLIPAFIAELAGYHRIIEPFAGIGGVHVVRDREVVGVEAESEWDEQRDGAIIGERSWAPYRLRGAKNKP